MKKPIFISLACLLLFPATAQPELIPAQPESVGISSERLRKIDQVVEDYISKNWFPGAVVLIARNGKIVYHKAYGLNDRDKKTVMKKDDIFRIASQTKAITSLAVMMLFEEGKFLLDDPISKYIPEFSKPTVLVSFNEKDSSFTMEPAKSEITIRHLLTHTSGIDYPVIGSKEFKAIYAKAGVPSGIGSSKDVLADKMKLLAKLPLKHQPGEKFTYGLNTDVLGYFVEVLSGISLDEFFRKKIFNPIGMNDTYFYLPKEKHNRLTTLYSEKDGKVVPATDSYKDAEPNYPNMQGKYYSGGAGLSSTIEDYAKFLQLFLNGGTYNGVRIISRKTVELMLTNQLSEKITDTFQFGLGFGLETEKNDFLTILSIGSFSWGGAFSTTYWADPKEKLIGLIYTQIAPTTHGDLGNKFKTLTYQAIVD